MTDVRKGLKWYVVCDLLSTFSQLGGQRSLWDGEAVWMFCRN